MKHTFASFVILLLSTFILISCKKNMPETPKVNRSVLVYVAANNNLNLHAASNLSDLISNYSESAMNGGNLIVYYNVKNNNAKLLQICNNTEAKVIKEYPTPHNAADPAILKAVIGDFKQLFPADSY
ncbi:MAG: clostripain-related cysteine peptidase, partial [Rikenellaceae bacterium]